jgi:hypothetical protein
MTKYEDIYDVCTKENFADIFESLGNGIAQEERIPLDQAILQAEISVWQMANPYKYMYGIIKEHHPSYAKPAEGEEPEKKVVKLPKKKAAEAPPSIANLAGGGADKSGWSAAKIDALPEDELHTVPQAIYKKWLSGDLT